MYSYFNGLLGSYFEGQSGERSQDKGKARMRLHSAARDALQTERLRLADYEHTITEVEMSASPVG